MIFIAANEKALMRAKEGLHLYRTSQFDEAPHFCFTESYFIVLHKIATVIQYNVLILQEIPKKAKSEFKKTARPRTKNLRSTLHRTIINQTNL